MLLRAFALGLAILSPGFSAAQNLPESYMQCRNAESPEAGIAACAEALKSPNLLQTERARTLLTLATYNRLKGDYPAALDAVAKAAAIAPNAAEIPAERAVVLHLRGDLSGARAAHAQAFALDSGSAAMFNNRGVTMLALGEAAAAIADFDSALLVMDENGTVLANRAAAKCRAGDAAGSVADHLASIGSDESRAAALEAAMASAGFEGGLGAGAGSTPDALAQWAAAGCPGAPAPEFL